MSDWPELDAIVSAWAAKGTIDARALAGMADEQKARSFWLANQWDTQFVGAMKGSLEKAMAEGTSFADWAKQAQGIINGYGGGIRLHGTGPDGKVAPWYADLVFRNATQGAFAGGRYTAMFSSERVHFAPYVQYRAILDARTRPEHRALNGRVFRKDDPTARRFFPPSAHNCRCYLIDMDETDFEDGGHQLTRGVDAAGIPIPGGSGTVGWPAAGWDVDRVEATRSRALAMVRGGPWESSEWDGPAPSEQPLRPPGAPPLLPPLSNSDEIFRAAKEIRRRVDAEEARVFGDAGPEVWKIVGPKGPPFRIPIPVSAEPIIKGKSFLHGHPPGGPLSLFSHQNDGDLSTAIALDMRNILATGRFEGNDVVSRMARPALGWPEETRASLAVAAVRLSLDDSAWATSRRAWIASLDDLAMRRQARARYDIEFRWELVRQVCIRLGIPYGIIITP
jgi:SPP1 gp7 family putative phage head morphogenesis protein